MTRSLGGRLLLALSAMLALFFGLTIWALDNIYRHALERAVRDRLATQVLALLTAAEPGPGDRLVLPAILPEPRLNNPGSGLFAEVADLEGRPLWRSGSAVGLEVPYPTGLAIGARRFHADLAAEDVGMLFTLTYAVDWEGAGTYLFSVAETQASYTAQVHRFRTQLFSWFGAMAALFVIAQGMLLRRVLQPLRRVADDLRAVEGGARTELAGDYPAELDGLTKGLNALIRNERGRLERYRNSLGDLAHSLKTPLAVMRQALAAGDAAREREQIAAQLARINEIVEYQLQRAAASGGTTFGAPLDVKPVAQRIVESLRKVYAARELSIETYVAPGCAFHGDAGDLMEILGNLADNACKHARGRVIIEAGRLPRAGRGARDGLTLAVSDDGPGLDATRVAELERRGVRGDTAAPGHGIGLAIVRDLVELHGGTLRFGRADLGGAEARVEIPPG